LLKKIKKFFQLFKRFYYLKTYFIYRVAPSMEHYRLLNNIDCKINTFIDIGANRGQFSSLVMGINSDSVIIAFEPLPIPAKKYLKLFNLTKNVLLYQNAIGPQEGNVKMHVSSRDDSSSLLNIGLNQKNIFPGTEELYLEDIKVAPLTHFLNKKTLIPPVFIKIDVQGYELEALKGCEELIQLINYIYVECSFIELYDGQALADEVIFYLTEHSFKLQGIYNTYYDKMGKAVQGDFLFIKS